MTLHQLSLVGAKRLSFSRASIRNIATLQMPSRRPGRAPRKWRGKEEHTTRLCSQPSRDVYRQSPREAGVRLNGTRFRRQHSVVPSSRRSEPGPFALSQRDSGDLLGDEHNFTTMNCGPHFHFIFFCTSPPPRTLAIQSSESTSD